MEEEIDDNAARDILTTAEHRYYERVRMAGVPALDEKARIPIEPYILGMLIGALRQRLPATGVSEKGAVE